MSMGVMFGLSPSKLCVSFLHLMLGYFIPLFSYLLYTSSQ
jgi:hypothetical protein